MTPSVERQLVNGVWQTHVVDEGGGGSTPNLEDVLTEGSDGGGLGITNAGAIDTGGGSLSTANPDSPGSGGLLSLDGGGIDMGGGGISNGYSASFDDEVAGGSFRLAGDPFGRAAWIDGSTATAEDIVNALIAAGLMAGS